MLDRNDKICEDAARVLDAGDFQVYLWNTGSTSQAISVTTPGTYSVSVTDQYGCSAGDTTFISSIIPAPANFLPQDMQICSYGNLTIEPVAAFQQYLWSNGETSSSIKITSPGIYWLQVSGFNDCLGRDTVVVTQKDCLEGFYIPNAFTPNNDGNNDVFLPHIFGRVVAYSFMIYNRFGQVVFKTIDISRGWDGANAGKPQGVGVYVWTCTYELEGKKTERKKGTVTLLR